MTAKQIKDQMLQLQADLNAARQKFIAALPEATAAQVSKIVKAIGSDTQTTSDVGFNKEFKITSEDSVKKVKAAATRRLNSLNTKNGKAKVSASLMSAKKITHFRIGKPSKKNKGSTLVSASWEV